MVPRAPMPRNHTFYCMFRNVPGEPTEKRSLATLLRQLGTRYGIDIVIRQSTNKEVTQAFRKVSLKVTCR